MGAGHDHSHDHEYDRKVLWIAFALNFLLFIIELWQGISVSSSSLIADSMDFLSDAGAYLITLFVLTRSLSVRARASQLKACIMLALAAVAIAQGVYNVIHEEIPGSFTMGWVATLALAANLITAALLYRTRGRDSNMESIWLCSRNDALANIFILIAAGIVYFTNSLWPDFAVAMIIAWLEGSAALKVFASAKKELKGIAHDYKTHPPASR